MQTVSLRIARKLSAKISGTLSGIIAGNNAESVGKFQPRVCFETLGSKVLLEILRNSEGVAKSLAVTKPRRNSLYLVFAADIS
jgi:hypothetical protein